MRKYRKETVEHEVLESISCDVCKKEFTDEMEMQEFVRIGFQGGYDSVFGDGVNFGLDICQHCLKEKLGEYIRVLDEVS